MAGSSEISRRLAAGLVVGLVLLGAPAGITQPVWADVPIPAVSPKPQSIAAFSTGFRLPANAALITGPTTDPAASQVATTALRGVSLTGASRQMSVFLGGPTENPASEQVLKDFGVPGPAGLPAGGYVLVAGIRAGVPTIVLSGVDAAGTFYAAQTLRQLIVGDTVPGVRVRDFPSFAMRGGEESFYGQPWSPADRLHQLDFLGQHKMNAFLYTVSGDARTSGALWRQPYPPDQLNTLATAVSRAIANHVDFIYRIDPEAPAARDVPGATMCHGDQADLDALIVRYQQLWDIGMRTLSIGWDDTDGELTCAADQRFKSDASPAAAAHAFVTNYLYDNFIATHAGAKLIAVPRDYFGTGATTYRTRYAALTRPQVTFFWTGPDVISRTITATDFSQAQSAFGGRPLIIFDNYPVNDYAGNQQHLGPLIGRDPALAQSAVGLLANEMQEEEASLLSLFTVADYDWNPSAYDAQDSWSRSIAEFGGTAADALRAYAENSVNSPLTSEVAPAPVVQPLILAFEQAFRAHADLTAPAAALLAELERVRTAPAILRSQLNNPSFLTESEPYFRTLEAQATAAKSAVAAIQAVNAGDAAAAFQARSQMSAALAGITGKYVAAGVYDRFVAFARGARPSTTIAGDNGAMSTYKAGADGYLYTAWQQSPGSTWQPFVRIGGTATKIVGTPDVIQRRSGALSAFARGSDNALWTTRQATPGAGWEPWTRLGGTISGSPRAVLSDSGQVNVFARGGSQLWTMWETAENSNVWSGFVQVANSINMTGDPDVILAADGTMAAFVRDINGHLLTSWQPTVGSAWHAWDDRGGGIAGDPRVVIGFNNAMSVYARGGNGQLFTAWQSGFGSTWSGLQQIGSAPIAGRPDVAVAPNGTLSAYARDSGGTIWTTWQSSIGGGWSASASLGAAFSSDPRVVESTIGGFSVLAVRTDGQASTSWQSWPGSGWSPWINLG